MRTSAGGGLCTPPAGRARAGKQAAYPLPGDRWGGPLEPIERGEPVVVADGRIRAVIEKNLDGLREARLGGVMKCRGSPAVGPLPGAAPVVDTRAVPQERGDVPGVVLASLV